MFRELGSPRVRMMFCKVLLLSEPPVCIQNNRSQQKFLSRHVLYDIGVIPFCKEPWALSVGR